MPINLKAYTAHQAKTPLQLEDYSLPELKSHELLVRVTHCGVCRSDAHFLDNDWGDSQFPVIPGHEVVGEIAQLGESVKHFKLGERVGVSWQQAACLQCEWCIQGKEEFCEALQAVCLGCRGGFADHVVVSQDFAYHLPENLGSTQVAPLLCAGATVFHALTSFEVRPGMRIGIIGMGGLGHLAVQFAKAMGCEVSVFSSSSEKEQEADRFGAKEFILNTDLNSLSNYQNRYDFILATTYVNLDYQAYVDALRPQGKLCFVGIPIEPIQVSVFSLVIGQKSVCAAPLGNRSSIQRMLQFAADHSIKPQLEVMPMSQVNEALNKVRQGQAKYRIVLESV